MTGWRLKPLPVSSFALTLAVEAAAVPLSWGLESRYDTVLYALYSVCLSGAGALVASREPRNAIGWLFARPASSVRWLPTPLRVGVCAPPPRVGLAARPLSG